MQVNEKIDFTYKGAVEEFIVPAKGLYMLEAWGGKGGSNEFVAGGAGGYTKGFAVLEKGEHIYVAVGGNGSTITGNGSSNRGVAGGYNGGGVGYGGSNGHRAGSGGGATHFGKTNAILANTPIENVLIVAGGGGGSYFYMQGDNQYTRAHCYGGAGGGLSGGGGQHVYPTYPNVNGGTQTAGYAYGQGGIDTQKYGGAGGGGGLYGGYGNVYCGAGGGSGYVGGANSITYKGVEYIAETTAGGNTGSAGKASITYIAKSFPEIMVGGVLLDGIRAFGADLDDIKIYGN